MSRREDPEMIASHAERLLNDDVLKGTLESMEAKCVKELMDMDMDVDYAHPNQQRDRMIIRLQETRQIRKTLKTLLDKGEVAARMKELKEA